MTTILVAGVIANKPLNGGEAWVRLSWLLGLKALGFHVHLVEQIDAAHCVDDAGNVVDCEQSINLAFFRSIVAQFRLSDMATLIDTSHARTYGQAMPELLDLAGAATLLINISGHLTFAPLMQRLRRKVYLDIDPGFTQFWHANGDLGARLAGYDHYFTIGENIGTPGCAVPTSGIHWRHTRQPVLLDQWPVATTGLPGRFTTVANWRGPYGPVQYQGRTYGLKVHEFRKVIALPQRVPHSFEIALQIHPADGADRLALRRHGWNIVDPTAVASDPMAFQRYVQTSGAEFSVAQGLYVETQSGWMSDRTVRYLASGKPALVQDTGFGRHYPAGVGLVSFRTLRQAIAGAEAIARDYGAHCRASRAIAAEYFDAAKVLRRFVEEIDVG